MKVRKHPGATPEGIIDHIKPVLQKKPDKIIIRTGTNDISNGINYLKSVIDLVKMTKEATPTTKICFSLIRRSDIKDGEEKIMEINNLLKKYCQHNYLDFIDNENLIIEDLGKRKLHPNIKGSKKLVKNFLNYLC